MCDDSVRVTIQHTIEPASAHALSALARALLLTDPDLSAAAAIALRVRQAAVQARAERDSRARERAALRARLAELDQNEAA